MKMDSLHETLLEQQNLNQSTFDIFKEMVSITFPMMIYFGILTFSNVMMQNTSANFENINYSMKVSITTIFFNLAWYAVVGCTYGLDIVGSFHLGQRNKKEFVNTFLNVSLLCGICLLIFGIPFYLLEFICFNFFNQTVDICNDISIYGILVFSGLVTNSYCYLFTRFLNMQGVVFIPTVIWFISTLIQYGLLQLYSNSPIDIAIGYVISRVLAFLAICNLCIIYTLDNISWTWKKAKEDILHLASVCVPSGFALILNDCIVDIGLYLMNYFSMSDESIVAFAVNITYSITLYVVVFCPLVVATGCIVGKSRGRHNHKEIVETETLMMFVLLIVSLIVIYIAYLCQDFVIISNNIIVQLYFRQAFMPSIYFTISNGLLNTLFGMLRGLEQPKNILQICGLTLVTSTCLQTSVFLYNGDIRTSANLFHAGSCAYLLSSIICGGIVVYKSRSKLRVNEVIVNTYVPGVSYLIQHGSTQSPLCRQ